MRGSLSVTWLANARTVESREPQVAGPHCKPDHSTARREVITLSLRCAMKATKPRRRISWD